MRVARFGVCRQSFVSRDGAGAYAPREDPDHVIAVGFRARRTRSTVARRSLERGELDGTELELLHPLGLGAGDASVVVGVGGLHLEVGLLGLGPRNVAVVVEVGAGWRTFGHVEGCVWGLASFREMADSTLPEARFKWAEQAGSILHFLNTTLRVENLAFTIMRQQVIGSRK